MTVLAGYIAASPHGGIVNPHMSGALSAYGADYWPPHAIEASSSQAGSVTRALPVSAHVRALAGDVAHSYVDDYYDRIHVIPAAIDLGNLLKSQTRTISVWNAWRTQSVTLNVVQQQNADGITLTAPGPTPMTFRPLQQRDWSVTVSTDGPATIDAVITWQFAGVASPRCTITGKRLTVWFTPPDWAGGVTETLIWLTDVQQAWHGAQDRTPLRAVPRREWEFAYLGDGVRRQAQENLLYAWRSRVWSMPVWVDQQHLTSALPANSSTIAVDTKNLDFATGQIALLLAPNGTHEPVEVADMTAANLTLARPTTQAWPAGTALYPCRDAMLTDTPQMTRDSAGVMHTRLRFRDEGASTWPDVAPSTIYLGYPVLLTHPNESTAPTAQFDRVIDQMDNDLGPINTTDRTGVAWLKQSYRWTLYGRADRAAHRSLLYWLNGRVQPLWVPTFADDLHMADLIAANATVIRVKNVGVSLYLQASPARQHIRIELNDGTCYLRHVTAASDLGDGTEQLAIDSALGVQVDVGDIRQVSWMMLATQATDQVQIEHLTDSLGVAQCTTTFVAVPREEPSA